MAVLLLSAAVGSNEWIVIDWQSDETPLVVKLRPPIAYIRPLPVSGLIAPVEPHRMAAHHGRISRQCSGVHNRRNPVCHAALDGRAFPSARSAMDCFQFRPSFHFD